MLHIDWFVRTMKRTFNVAVNIDEVGYEAYEFYHEELDNYLVPEEHLEKLPNPLLFETLTYVDDNRNEWIAGFVKHVYTDYAGGRKHDAGRTGRRLSDDFYR
jgi:hypothetical protein